MNVSMKSVNVLNFAGAGGGLKSTQEKMERKQQCADQVNFFEKQKENLKNMKCGSLEEIARKLDMFHSYEDQIAEAKKAFNNSQMSHVLDEAKEIGEKIAKAAEEMAPKTPEERREEHLEEAMGNEEENKGMLSEIMEEMSEMTEEMQELEEQKEAEEAAATDVLEELTEEPESAAETKEDTAEDMQTGSLEQGAMGSLQEAVEENLAEKKLEEQELQKEQDEKQKDMVFMSAEMRQYQHIDYRL